MKSFKVLGMMTDKLQLLEKPAAAPYHRDKSVAVVQMGLPNQTQQLVQKTFVIAVPQGQTEI